MICCRMTVIVLFGFGVWSLGEAPVDAEKKAADDLFTQGYFKEAQERYETLSQSSPDNAEILHRLGSIRFFEGEFQKAIPYFRKVADLDPSKKKPMLAYTACACYLQKDYSNALKALKETGPVNLLNIEQVAYLAEHPPYSIDSPVDRTVVPFNKAALLPVIPIEVNSRKIFVLVDTGAVQLIIDSEHAKENGIKPIAQQTVQGAAGGKEAPVSFAVVEAVTLGEIKVRDVPVMLAETRRFSKDFGVEINGILGTELLMQFLPTLDYPNGELILRIRNEQNKAAIANTKAKVRIPFIIDGIHAMYAQCRINGKSPVLMYFDSGLADTHGASLVLTGAALADLGIAKPTEFEEGEGLGGAVRSRYVDIDKVSVGNLIRTGQKATYQQGVEGTLLTYAGYKTYGIISHHFLRHYRWTIDFDNRVFLFDD